MTWTIRIHAGGVSDCRMGSVRSRYSELFVSQKGIGVFANGFEDASWASVGFRLPGGFSGGNAPSGVQAITEPRPHRWVLQGLPRSLCSDGGLAEWSTSRGALCLC